MAMMAKSKMHEELVSKANNMKLNHTETNDTLHTSTLSNNNNNNNNNTTTTTELLDYSCNDTVDNQVVSSHVKHIETKLMEQKDGGNITTTTTVTSSTVMTNGKANLDESETDPLINATTDKTDNNGDVRRSAATSPVTPTAAPKSKLYDSLFADRKLTEKEMKRRQFLFGVAPAPAKPKPKPAAEPVATKEPPAAAAVEARPTAPPQPPPVDPPRPASPDSVDKPVKQKKKCCCTIQ